MSKLHFPNKPLRILLLVVAIPILLTAAWGKVLDQQSLNYIDDSLLGAGAIYATARGINAIVSVIQGTEVDAVFITLAVGELLDPINDLIERFSAIMLVALGSLAMQRILLDLASHDVFNVLISLMAATTFLALMWGKVGVYQSIAKIFLITIVIRFALVLTVLMNGAVDLYFLSSEEKEQHGTMRELHSNLAAVTKTTGMNITLSDDIEELENQIGTTKYALELEQKALLQAITDFENEKFILESLPKKSLADYMNIPLFDFALPYNSSERQKQINKLDRLQKSMDLKGVELSSLENKITEMKEKLSCLKERADGGSCSWKERLDKVKRAFDFRQQISELAEEVDMFYDDTIKLLVSLVLRSIIFPLGILYTVIALCRRALRVEV